MRYLTKKWNFISYLGISEVLSPADAKRARLINQLNFFAFLFNIFYLLLFYCWDHGALVYLQLAFTLFFLLIFFLCFKKHHYAAKILFSIGVCLIVFFMCLCFGEGPQMHLLLIPVASVPLVLFDLKKIRIIIFLTLLPLVAYLLLCYLNFSWFISIAIPPQLWWIKMAFNITGILAEIIIIGFLVTNYDKVEKLLDEKNIILQTQLQSIFDSSFDALFLVNGKERTIMRANNRAVKLFEMEKESDFVGKHGPNFHTNLSKAQTEAIRDSLQKKGFYEGEILYKTSKGNEFWGSITIALIYILNIPYQSVRITDITEQKKTEKQIQTSLHEKEVLLAEIHHRVKNNLAVISGLLGLQSSYIEDEKAKALFQESRNRIHSMALIHDKLYQHETFAKIDFCTYINDLTSHIQRSYQYAPSNIEFTLGCTNIFLDIKTAIPCGLILNELITNSYKHAFIGREKGEIKIECIKAGNTCTIMVNDNGVGFNADEALKKSNSLGLTLINALTEQINGTVKTVHDNGTGYCISFEL